MYCSSFFWTILSVSLLFVETYSVNANPPAVDSRLASETGNASDNHIELMIPSNQGLVSWQAVAVEVANSLRLDPTTIQTLFPSGQIDLGSDGARLILLGLDLAMGESVSLSLIHPDGGPPALRLRIDRRAFGLPTSPTGRTATIEIDADWRQRATSKPLLVCFHGLYSGPDVFAGLRSGARDAGFATAAISYDDRRAIGDTASDISIQFDRLLVDAHENVRLMLVGHSMGGLVAREWTENRTLKGDRIAGLITVGTPHGGSSWAVLPPLLDLFDEGRLDASRLADVLLHQPSAPGFRDLATGSEFLQQLAARPLRDGVQYSTIAGTGSPIAEQDLQALQQALRELDQEGSLVRLIRPRIQPLLENFDELVSGKGDGAVAVSRATIPGVDDILIVNRLHGELLSPPKSDETQPVWQAILTRIEEL
jgi:pimeloyl-ACP methyl ester carboxylesterase